MPGGQKYEERLKTPEGQKWLRFRNRNPLHAGGASGRMGENAALRSYSGRTSWKADSTQLGQ
jgi:hypothetical protein